jgi:hypothetical protein
VAIRQLAAKFDDLATLRHLNEDTARAQRSQSASERVSLIPSGLVVLAVTPALPSSDWQTHLSSDAKKL